MVIRQTVQRVIVDVMVRDAEWQTRAWAQG